MVNSGFSIYYGFLGVDVLLELVAVVVYSSYVCKASNRRIVLSIMHHKQGQLPGVNNIVQHHQSCPELDITL